MRLLTGLAAFLVLALALAGCRGAKDSGTDKDPLVNCWKIIFLNGTDVVNFGLVKLDATGGPVAATLDVTPTPGPNDLKFTVQKVALHDETLTLTLQVGRQSFDFAFKAPKGESKRLCGTLTVGRMTVPAQLELTKEESAKGFEPELPVKVPEGGFQILKDDVARRPDDLGLSVVARNMIIAAGDEKASAAEVRSALVPVLDAARQYGAWHREVLLQFAGSLSYRGNYATLVQEFAEEALKEFGDRAGPAIQLRCLDLIALSLLKQDKKTELAKVRARIDELEEKGLEESEKEGLGFDPAKFDRPRGNRVVLVELFTGAHCPPCVAADLAFEGVGKTYSPSDVVLLQYHLHNAGPDPMTTPETEARAQYYGDAARGTPSTFFNGKSGSEGGGYRPHAQAKYHDYRAIIDPLLEGDNKITLAVDARRAGDTIIITAAAAGYKPADKLKLRMAVVEPWVRYPGSNGIGYHIHVVRALPGGAAGIALTKDNATETAMINLAELRQSVSKSLDQFEMLEGQRPFAFRNLRVVAFVQDDDSKEVLHAVEVPVK